jgi:VWFA-related protein
VAAQESLSVVALDRQGQPVLDLKADEVQLTDNGQPLALASFARFKDAGGSPTLVLYDLLNTPTAARGNVPRDIAESLERNGTEAQVYLYLLAADGTLVPVHALDSTEASGWPRNAGATLDAALRKTNSIRPKYLDTTGARVKATYAAVGELSTALSKHPGRKTMVWITHGVPLSAISANGVPVDYRPTLKKFAAAIGREQVVIHPVQQTVRANAQMEDSSRDTLQHFADLTGGRMYATETVAQAIADAVRDTAASYVLTFAPAFSNPDGKFHSIRLTCTRPGIRLHARQGYFAEP